jgi:RimJ/RimL family protein N-acetyltransferase
MIKGKLVTLNAVEEEDLPRFQNWRNNPEFRKYFREYKELNMRQQEIWFEEKVMNDNTTLMFSIKRNEDNEPLGCCGFVYINWVHRHADLSLYIGWNNEYIDNEGYAKESCRLLMNYGFKELNLNKIWTEIYDFDNKKQALYKQLGFHQDGLLRKNYWYDGKWWDSRILSKLHDEI